MELRAARVGDASTDPAYRITMYIQLDNQVIISLALAQDADMNLLL